MAKNKPMGTKEADGSVNYQNGPTHTRSSRPPQRLPTYYGPLAAIDRPSSRTYLRGGSCASVIPCYGPRRTLDLRLTLRVRQVHARRRGGAGSAAARAR